MLRERDVTRDILLATSDRVLWGRNNVGVAERGGRHIRYGVGGTGGSDLLGVLRRNGRAIACEVKGPGGRVTVEQERFLACVRSAGGLGFVARSVEDVENQIKEKP